MINLAVNFLVGIKISTSNQREDEIVKLMSLSDPPNVEAEVKISILGFHSRVSSIDQVPVALIRDL